MLILVRQRRRKFHELDEIQLCFNRRRKHHLWRWPPTIQVPPERSFSKPTEIKQQAIVCTLILFLFLHRYWSSATRAITIKDMQKLMEHFTSKFASEVQENFMKEMRKLNIKDEEESSSYESEEDDEETTNGYTEATSEVSTTTQTEEEGLLLHDFTRGK